MNACLRWGYLLAMFSFLSMMVAFFLYGQNVMLPDQTSVSLFYRAGFFFATPLAAALGIESLFVLIMLAGFFQIVVSFTIGVTAGLLFRVVRELA